jgi:DNA-binding MarR family transcriptional regulator
VNTLTSEEHLPENWPLGRLLSAAARTVERSWASALQAHGLTHAGLVVLHLLELGFDSQTEIARVAGVQAQTMSRTVDRLEREGLVTRSPSAHDRRSYRLLITPDGRAAFLAARDLEDDVFPDIDDRDAFRRMLVRIVVEAPPQR